MKKLIVLIPFLLLFFVQSVSAATVSLTVSGSGGTARPQDSVDKNQSTYADIAPHGAISYLLTNAGGRVYIQMSRKNFSSTVNVSFQFYDKDAALIITHSSSNYTTYFEYLIPENAHYFNISTTSGVFVNEVWADEVDRTPPAIPTNLKATPGVLEANVTWNPVSDSDLAGYNLYVDGTKVNNGLITETQYKVTNLIADRSYTVTVSAVDKNNNESNRSGFVSVVPQAPLVTPTLNYGDIKSTSIRLTWPETASIYEVYQDGVMLRSLTAGSLFYDATNLTPNTSYSFQLITYDRYGRRAESNVLQLKTEAPMPLKPTLKTSDITYNSFKLSWTSDVNTTQYTLYLEQNQIATFTNETEYVFTNLSPSTIYSFRLVANGIGGSEQSTASVRTLEAPIPQVTGAKISPVPNEPNKRQLNYTTNDLVTGVKVYVGQNLVGTYPVSENGIILDFADLEELMVDVKVEPIDQDGKAYELATFAKSSGDEKMDAFLALLLNIYSLLKKAFWVLAIGSIPVLIGVLFYFWSRRKYKKLFDTGKVPQEQPNVKEYHKETEQIREERVPYRRKPWAKMTEQEKLEHRSKRHEKQTGFKIVAVKKVRVGKSLFSPGKVRERLTYERNGVQYEKRYVRGQGRVYQPKDFKNQVKHVSNQFKAVKSAFTGSNKKTFH